MDGLTILLSFCWNINYDSSKAFGVFASQTHLIGRGNLKFSVRNREPTPKLLRGDVCSIFYSDVLLDGSHQTPELLLHQLCGYHLKRTHDRRHSQLKYSKAGEAHRCTLKPASAYMNWHVEVIWFECISHLPKCTQGVISVCLFKAERLLRFVAFLWVRWKKESTE